MAIPRNEYPRPQMERGEWMNLNGTWEFETDFGKTGRERGLAEKERLEQEILVPFCPESTLSGIGYRDFMNAVWYRRTFALPKGWKDGRILLHFEAVDYESEVWINGVSAGTHRGGYTPFTLDITDLVDAARDNVITVCAEDDPRTGKQPCGKQSVKYASSGCDYTRVTGIWQTVWLEHVPKTYLKSYRVDTDRHNGSVDVELKISGQYEEKQIRVIALYHGKTVGEFLGKTCGDFIKVHIPLSEVHLWEPLAAELYDLEIEITSGTDCDLVKGYFGIRELQIDRGCVLINGKPVFQRLVLDQGFYPDGIYTAPDDAALAHDIDLSIAMGFNGARLHQKVFERRYLYYADQKGYLVWGEYGNWHLNHTGAEALAIFLPEWMESVARDYNSPALIGWCPFNETWDYKGSRQDDTVLRNVYLVTKAMDPTRPVIDTSGNFHVITDIYDTHDYEQDVAVFAEHYREFATDRSKLYDKFSDRQTYRGEPCFISEYGGIRWGGDKNSWGYGNSPKTKEEFIARYVGLADVLLSNPNIFALCYTQLYDVEQEVNGLYDYNRLAKFTEEETEKLAAAMKQTAAIEK